MGRFIRFFSGALIGAFIGSVVAILLAPSSGSVLRSRITENASHMQDEVRQAAIEKRIELENV